MTIDYVRCCVAAASALFVGCAVLPAATPPDAHGLQRGDVFILRQDSFYYVYGKPSILPPESEVAPFSVDDYRRSPNSDDRRKYVKGVIPTGTRIQFIKVKRHGDLATGMRTNYYGKVLTGEFRGRGITCVDHLLFVGGRENGLSSRYVKWENAIGVMSQQSIPLKNPQPAVSP